MSLIKKFFKLSLRDKLLASTEYISKKTQKWMNFYGRYNFVIDNRKNFENLLIIVAGYQKYLYEKVLNRVNKYMENNIDVIIVTPGKKDDELIKYAEKFGRSYLRTKDNKLTLAQNIAIKIHPNAEFIYKMDEDIFITKGFFSKLKEKYETTLKESEFIPGGITPVLNINGFSYSYFLDVVNKKKEFIEKFGILKQEVCKEGENIWYSGKVAKWIRNLTLPIDKIQENYFDKIDIEKTFIPNAIRYSIGCYMFTREIRNSMGGGDVAIDGQLGKEEEQYLSYCIVNSRPIILCENSLCGHFSFGPQKKDMKDFYEKNKDLF